MRNEAAFVIFAAAVADVIVTADDDVVITSNDDDDDNNNNDNEARFENTGLEFPQSMYIFFNYSQQKQRTKINLTLERQNFLRQEA